MMPILLTVLLSGGMAGYGIRHLVVVNRRKKKHEELANAYQHLLLQHRVVVDHYEISRNRVLALDRKNKRLVVVDHNRLARQERCIPLLSVGEARVLEEKNKNGFIERIVLQFRHKGNESFYEICFFDKASDVNVDLPGAARRAVMWKKGSTCTSFPALYPLGRNLCCRFIIVRSKTGSNNASCF